MRIKYLILSWVLIYFTTTTFYGQKSDSDILQIVKLMTLEEKASICAGKDFWNTQEIEHLNIPSILMTDGPHGVRLATEGAFSSNQPATCFPTASLLASTWDVDLINKMGIALGVEAGAKGVQILLGPGINIKRSPLGGRNFEYFSEDPILSGKLGGSYIRGVQSNGIGTSLKHFAVNNQETFRIITSANVDERSLREIYLTSFEIAIKEANPTSVMSAYNKVNGIYCSENNKLLNNILRKEWGFKGLVVSDWGAVNNRVEAIKAGLDLQMPGDKGYMSKKIIEAINDGSLKEVDLDKAVINNLKVIFKVAKSKQLSFNFDSLDHHILAKEIASQGIVLLKNENQALPLLKTKKQTISIIGQFAKSPRFQGAGSSLVNPTFLDNTYDSFFEKKGDKVKLSYAEGYDELGNTNDFLIKNAIEIAEISDVTIIFVGLPEEYESEGFDRTSIELPKGHNHLVFEVAKVAKKLVIVLQNGSPVSMPWIDKTDAIIEAYLGGQAGGAAIADILWGNINPSGKLAETFPKRIEDTPSYLNFPGTESEITYGEGIFVGYRYYDKTNISPLFPFGHGLSYTNFSYSDITVNKDNFKENDSILVTCKIKNIGNVEGKEIIQLYVSDVESTIIRPDKELKNFVKINLKPGEEKTVHFNLKPRDFKFYSPKFKSWVAENGRFDIQIGSSSKNIHLKKTVSLYGTKTYSPNPSLTMLIKEMYAHPMGRQFIQNIYDALVPAPAGATEEQKLTSSKQRKALIYSLSNSPVNKLILLSNGTIKERALLRIINLMKKHDNEQTINEKI